MIYWQGTWVDTEEELNSYKYKKESPDALIDLVKVARIFATNMTQVHHKNMMRQQEEKKDDWESWSQLHKSTLNLFELSDMELKINGGDNMAKAKVERKRQRRS